MDSKTMGLVSAMRGWKVVPAYPTRIACWWKQLAPAARALHASRNLFHPRRQRRIDPR